MRVLIITWACDLQDVSEPEISARWVQEISKDHDVTVFSVSRPERFGCVKEQFGHLNVIEWRDIRVPHFLERFRAIVKPWYFVYYFKARNFLKKYLITHSFDVIHHVSPLAWRYPSPAAGLGVPLIRGPVEGGLDSPEGLNSKGGGSWHPFMFLRNTDGFRIRYDPLLRASYRDTERLLIAAPYVRRLLESLSLQDVSIETDNGVPESRYHTNLDFKPESSAPVKLLFVGRIVPTKGLFYAIQAFKQSNSSNLAVLTVIGDGDDLDRCKIEANRLGLEEKVRFLGWQSKEDVIRHYESSDVFIFPSFREPTGGVFLEAMAYGLPCVACDYGGPEYLIDESCGIKVRPDNEEYYVANLANAMDILVMNADLRKRMAISAMNRAREVFGWDAKRKRMTNLYHEVANSKV